MNDLATLTAFFGWCTAINFGLLTISTLVLYALNEPVKRLHSALTHVDPADLDRFYFQFLGNYKLAIFIFNLVPWIALKLIA